MLSRRFTERTVSIWTSSITLNTGADVPPEVEQTQTTRCTNPKHDIIWTNTTAKTRKPVQTCCITFSWTFKNEFLNFHDMPIWYPFHKLQTTGMPDGFCRISFNCSCPTPTHKFVPNHFTVLYNVSERRPLHTLSRAQLLDPMIRDNFPLHALHVKYPSLSTLTAGYLLQQTCSVRRIWGSDSTVAEMQAFWNVMPCQKINTDLNTQTVRSVKTKLIYCLITTVTCFN